YNHNPMWVEVWSLDDDAPEKLRTIELPSGTPVSAAAWSDTLASLEVTTLRIRAARTGATTDVALEPVRAFTVSPRGHFVAVATSSELVQIRAVPSGELVRTLAVPPQLMTDPLMSLSISANEDHVVAERQRGPAIVWAIADGSFEKPARHIRGRWPR